MPTKKELEQFLFKNIKKLKEDNENLKEDIKKLEETIKKYKER